MTVSMETPHSGKVGF